MVEERERWEGERERKGVEREEQGGGYPERSKVSKL
jgi:hypothetical protein